jgi:hypothetical protein
MSIFDLFSSDQGTAAANKAYAAQKQGINTAKNDFQAFGKKATKYGEQALPAWQTVFGQGTSLAPTYFGASGVGTPEQIAGAQNAWQSSIPYQQFQNELPGIYEAALRRGGLTGQTGQIPIDLNNEAMKALNQFYPGWQASLNPYSWETAGASGLANAYGKLSDTAMARGTGLAALDQSKGQAGYQLAQNLYGAQSGADANQLSALFGLGNLLMTPFGSGGAKWGSSTGGSYDPNWSNTQVNYG